MSAATHGIAAIIGAAIAHLFRALPAFAWRVVAECSGRWFPFLFARNNPGGSMSLLHRQLLTQFLADIEAPAAKVIEALVTAANPVAGAAATAVIEEGLKPLADQVLASSGAAVPPPAAAAPDAPAGSVASPAASAPAAAPPAAAPLPQAAQQAALAAVQAVSDQLASLATQLEALKKNLGL